LNNHLAPFNKILTYLAIAALFDIVIFQNIVCCSNVYSQKLEIKYAGQLGSKGTADGQFKTPHSLAVDPFGNIYVGDTGNKRIQKFSPNGTFLTSWGSAGTANGQFLGLHDVAVDPKGVFV
jgi:hypothetical protein